jgi:RTX calcium-binding nonapeptide repeat (4 copies)
MKEQYKISRSLGRAAAATTLIGIAVAASTAPAQATPARASASVVDQVLAISGTSAANEITVDFTAVDSVAVNLGRGEVERFDPRTFRSVSVHLGSGDDRFRTLSGALVDVPITVRGGSGSDEVLGGAANDTIHGGSGEDVLLGGAGTDLLIGGRGADFVNGNVGTDTEILGSGDDVAAWKPGEGSDVVDGGLGGDTLLFNGSDGDERMSLAADGSSAVFLRSPGTIRMDLDEVERLDLNAFGGADAVTVGDLTGTGLTAADIDLASSDGTGDRKTDTVVVDGTDRADLVDVTASVGAVDVSGLAARTVLTGSDPDDRLAINTLGGNDRLEVDPAVNALITLAFDLGAGQL